LNIEVANFGEDHVEVIPFHENNGEVCFKLKKYDKALLSYKEAHLPSLVSR